ncbi:MAG: ribosomal protection-like ABC-F family protein [Candidatus Roizmanbacteria bacterium]
MLTLKDISKTYQDRIILNTISFSLNDNETVGLVGLNGSGKTTLLKIIKGDVLPDTGTVDHANGKIGYLPQHFQISDETVEQFLKKYADAQEEYKIRTVLTRVQLDDILLSQKVKTLSGGQKTKLHLGVLLLQGPTILLLDEPTNNLDLDGLLWLEQFVKGFKGSILLTSHDRSFLDSVTSRVIELDGGEARSYGGNYTFYKGQKEIEKQTATQSYRENIRKSTALERAIDQQKNRHENLSISKKLDDNDKMQSDFLKEKSTQKTAQSKKALETRLRRVGHTEKPEEYIHYPFDFKGDVHSSRCVLEAKNISMRYGKKVVIKDASCIVLGQERIWISGKNGSGKSTLLKILVGKVLSDEGSVEIGSLINVGYFSQEFDGQENEKSVLQELESYGASITDSYKYARFMNLKEDALKSKISNLSRGQQTKVEFIKLLMGDFQVLVLDEPTNHLEVSTREMIEEALMQYKGAIIVASHDRYFLERIGIDREYGMEDGTLFLKRS